jgi:hypothetical protein
MSMSAQVALHDWLLDASRVNDEFPSSDQRDTYGAVRSPSDVVARHNRVAPC